MITDEIKITDDWTFRHQTIPEHMRAGIELYVNRGILLGSFLRAIICNDLSAAVANADAVNMGLIPVYTAWFYNEAPSTCWGSPEKMKAWMRSKQAAAKEVSNDQGF